MGFEIPEDGSLTGLVLAASRDLLDPNFNQTLVYIAEHGPDGTLGLVMNRPLDKKLGEVALSPDLPKALQQIPVFPGRAGENDRVTVRPVSTWKERRTGAVPDCRQSARAYRVAQTRMGTRVRRSFGMECGTTRTGIKRRLMAGMPAAHGDAGRISPECHVGGVRRQGPAVEEIAAASAKEHRAELTRSANCFMARMTANNSPCITTVNGTVDRDRGPLRVPQQLPRAIYFRRHPLDFQQPIHPPSLACLECDVRTSRELGDGAASGLPDVRPELCGRGIECLGIPRVQCDGSPAGRAGVVWDFAQNF